MTKKIHYVDLYAVDWAYDCPYCGKPHLIPETSLTDEFHEEVHWCDDCGKEFKIRELGEV